MQPGESLMTALASPLRKRPGPRERNEPAGREEHTFAVVKSSRPDFCAHDHFPLSIAQILKRITSIASRVSSPGICASDLIGALGRTFVFRSLDFHELPT
jgi:hypothetical protein